ncbi:MAG: DNA-3-methyladenine glycosylase I [Acidobacteriota bacterium]|jgi:DNA-3-methyladenine glycosylase I
MTVRCDWSEGHELLISYHDEEWGVPETDDRALFEKLILDGAQAGLSWLTILKRREGYRRAFEGFDPERVARYDERDVARLLGDEGIIRNRQKVRSAIGNARAFLDLVEETGSFSDYLWGFVDGTPVVHHYRSHGEIPATSPVSERLSKDLQGRGFSFVGPTIIYAYMQAVGMVNDHVVDCFRHAPLAADPAD